MENDEKRDKPRNGPYLLMGSAKIPLSVVIALFDVPDAVPGDVRLCVDTENGTLMANGFNEAGLAQIWCSFAGRTPDGEQCGDAVLSKTEKFKDLPVRTWLYDPRGAFCAYMDHEGPGRAPAVRVSGTPIAPTAAIALDEYAVMFGSEDAYAEAVRDGALERSLDPGATSGAKIPKTPDDTKNGK